MWLIIMSVLLLLVGAYITKLSFEKGHILIVGLYFGGMALILSIVVFVLGIKLL